MSELSDLLDDALSEPCYCATSEIGCPYCDKIIKVREKIESLQSELEAERAANSRFTANDVRKMRRLHNLGFSYSAIGREFLTSANTVRRIVLGITWAALKEA